MRKHPLFLGHKIINTSISTFTFSVQPLKFQHKATQLFQIKGHKYTHLLELNNVFFSTVKVPKGLNDCMRHNRLTERMIQETETMDSSSIEDVKQHGSINYSDWYQNPETSQQRSWLVESADWRKKEKKGKEKKRKDKELCCMQLQAPLLITGYVRCALFINPPMSH